MAITFYNTASEKITLHICYNGYQMLTECKNNFMAIQWRIAAVRKTINNLNNDRNSKSS